MTDGDRFQRFLFEDLGVRGEFIRLDASWRAVLACHDYTPAVYRQLGQAIAATVLLAGTIKFKGSLILQIHGDGPLHTLVAQSTHARTLRGLARCKGDVGDGTLSEMYGSGRLVLTIDAEGAERYQGIVALEGNNLAEVIEIYFTRSEQLSTHLWLAANEERAVGMFIQELPSHDSVAADWERIAMLADTVTEQEMLTLPTEELLFRLFNEERVRLFQPEPVAFRCGCSRERIEATLVALGSTEVQSIVSEFGAVDVDCEFCNRRYHFDPVDVDGLFAIGTVMEGSTTRH
ncbi:MAG: Hsp33 family molecular chaperone HslO [Gammaproteobacteria bacterium]|nr:Hsp33 family molecular chaperone HslO [Gammaproteobacteria bacterium]